MGSMRAAVANAQAGYGVVCRAALSLVGMSLGCTVGLHLVADAAFSQTPLSQTPSTAAIERSSAPSTDSLLRPTLKSGSRGADVTELQATLKLLGYYGGSVDGVYGQTTVSAVAQFQQAAGLSADGITGPATWNRLFPEATAVSGVAPTVSSITPVTPAVNSAPVSPTNSAASFPVPSGVTPASSPSKPPATSPRPSGATPSTPASKPSKPTTADRPAAAGTSTAEPTTLPVLRQGMKGSAVMALQQRLRSLGVLKGAADGVFGAETLAAVKAAQRSFKLDPDGIVGAATWSAILR